MKSENIYVIKSKCHLHEHVHFFLIIVGIYAKKQEPNFLISTYIVELDID